jgi:hypothetical protein
MAGATRSVKELSRRRINQSRIYCFIEEGREMMLDVRTPPVPTGDAEKDYSELWRWCELFRRRVMIMLSNIDDENIASVSADKIIESEAEIEAVDAVAEAAQVYSIAELSETEPAELQEGEQTE